MVLGLQRTAGNRAVATLLQRVGVPGTQLDSSRAGDWGAIENHMLGRSMTIPQLGELIARLETVRELSQFERILLSFARYRNAEMRDIDNVYKNAAHTGGVWTMATILVDGEQRLVTIPERAGVRRGEERMYHDHPTELTESENDSEVATLATLTEFFERSDFSTWKNVNLIFSGSMGPCDGCKERLQGFVEDVARMARNARASFRLILDVNYSTETNPSRQRRTTYGYGDDTELIDLPSTPEEYSYWTKRFVRDCGE